MNLKLVLAAALLATGYVPARAQPEPLHLLGEHSFPSKTTFGGTTVGGLSGITYDARRGVYYAVSDDRGEFQPPRFYTLQIDLGPQSILDVRVIGVTTLDSDAATPGIQPYERNDSDMEEIALLPGDELLISSERDREGRPWVRRFTLNGALLGELPVPEKFQPVFQTDEAGRNTPVRGTRPNLGFEGMALAPDATTLYVANEEALGQDGPVATQASGTNVRLLRYQRVGAGWAPGPEYAYRTQPIFAAPAPPDAFADNGVSAMLWVQHVLPGFELLVMERSFATGVGNDVNIFSVRLGPARDVSVLDSLAQVSSGAVSKTLLFNLARAGVSADNLEGMTFGPRLANGNLSLILVSDDNFGAFDPPQVNQFVAIELQAGVSK